MKIFNLYEFFYFRYDYEGVSKEDANILMQSLTNQFGEFIVRFSILFVIIKDFIRNSKKEIKLMITVMLIQLISL